MKGVKGFFSYVCLVMALFLMLPSSAYALGQATEMNFHGVSSGASYGEENPDGTTTWHDDDQDAYGIDQVVESSLLGGDVWAQTSPYSMHGYLDGSTATNGEVSNMTLDELYFATTSGEAASIDFNFNLAFKVEILDLTKSLDRYDSAINLKLGVLGASWIDGQTFLLRSSDDVNIGGNYDYFVDVYDTKNSVYENSDGSFTYTTPDATFAMTNGEFDFSSPITLSTAGWAGVEQGIDGLVESGTYLPIALTIEAGDSSGNVIINYKNSFDINSDNPYDLYDSNRNPLATAFTLASLENFDQPSTSTVPEPASLLLFGSGLVGAFIKRRKV